MQWRIELFDLDLESNASDRTTQPGHSGPVDPGNLPVLAEYGSQIETDSDWMPDLSFGWNYFAAFRTF